MRGLTPFIEDVPEIAIQEGIVHFYIGEHHLCCATLATYRKGLARANRVMAEHDARLAEVLPIHGHAARSLG